MGDTMKRVLVAAALLSVVAVGCGKDKADTPECKRWQGLYAYWDAQPTTGIYGGPTGAAAMKMSLLRARPDGCPIP